MVEGALLVWLLSFHKWLGPAELRSARGIHLRFFRTNDGKESLFAILRAHKAPRLKLLLLEEALYTAGLNQLPEDEFRALVLSFFCYYLCSWLNNAIYRYDTWETRGSSLDKEATTLRRVKLVNPKSVEAPPKTAPIVAEVTFETTIAPPQPALPPTIKTPQFFPPCILIKGIPKAMPGSKPSTGGRENVFPRDWKDIWEVFESILILEGVE